MRITSSLSLFTSAAALIGHAAIAGNSAATNTSAPTKLLADAPTETVKTAPAKATAKSAKADGKADSKGDSTTAGKARGGKRTAKIERKKTCLSSPIQFEHGKEDLSFALTRCDGAVAPLAQEKLSVMLRPGSQKAPEHLEGAADFTGVKLVDQGLVSRLQDIAQHFKKGENAKFVVISGVRPKSAGSLHRSAKAMDVRLEGVTNEALVAYCKTLTDTGCGYYPNSSFVHVDVRKPGTGHVSWIDISGPGESPNYVMKWPLEKGTLEQNTAPHPPEEMQSPEGHASESDADETEDTPAPPGAYVDGPMDSRR